MVDHPHKRLRRLEIWEASIYDDNVVHGSSSAFPRKSLGLSELFGSRRPSDVASSVTNRTSSSSSIQRRLGGAQGGFFTFRLEHRPGGSSLMGHRGEERLLLFRSDRPGVIGKIIYSSQPPVKRNEEQAGVSKEISSSGMQSDVFGTGNERKCDFNPDALAQAKIHCLDVKNDYRGRDLGGLLFREAIYALTNKYGYISDDHNTDTEECDSVDSSSQATVNSAQPKRKRDPYIFCQLDAEEDTQRHNKLVHFYEELGCHTKPNARIRYLNNNDGETYRKVPMQMLVGSSLRNPPSVDVNNINSKRCELSSLVGKSGGFLPVQLLESNGQRVHMPVDGAHRTYNWVVQDEGCDGISFRTTQGVHLCVEPDGKVVANRLKVESWESFKLRRVPDCDGSETDPEMTHSDEVRRKELWTIQSSHGSFLGIENHALSCSSYPTFWQVDDDTLSLACTQDTPRRRQHYRQTWLRQSVSFVRAMREKYLKFQCKQIGVWEALQLAKDIPSDPFGMNNDNSVPSLRTKLFRTAEEFRRVGHPDWVQLVALIHDLGRIINSFETGSGYGVYNWTIMTSSGVVGCAPPTCAVFQEYRNLDPDRHHEMYNSPLGMYEANTGMENLLLNWTGPEYMYYLLKENCVSIPEDGLVMLRLFQLRAWHTHNEYNHLANDADMVMRPLVADFDQGIRRGKQKSYGLGDLTDNECKNLWNSHYLNIMEKYDCAGKLRW